MSCGHFEFTIYILGTIDLCQHFDDIDIAPRDDGISVEEVEVKFLFGQNHKTLYVRPRIQVCYNLSSL